MGCPLRLLRFSLGEYLYTAGISFKFNFCGLSRKAFLSFPCENLYIYIHTYMGDEEKGMGVHIALEGIYGR